LIFAAVRILRLPKQVSTATGRQRILIRTRPIFRPFIGTTTRLASTRIIARLSVDSRLAIDDSLIGFGLLGVLGLRRGFELTAPLGVGAPPGAPATSVADEAPVAPVGPPAPALPCGPVSSASRGVNVTALPTDLPWLFVATTRTLYVALVVRPVTAMLLGMTSLCPAGIVKRPVVRSNASPSPYS
jgi:hypothetical protein